MISSIFYSTWPTKASKPSKQGNFDKSKLLYFTLFGTVRFEDALIEEIVLKPDVYGDDNNISLLKVLEIV